MKWTWYLALDFQLFLMAPVFVKVMQKFRQRGVAAIILLTLVLIFNCYYQLSG
jgi:hypothetical protein